MSRRCSLRTPVEVFGAWVREEGHGRLPARCHLHGKHGLLSSNLSLSNLSTRFQALLGHDAARSGPRAGLCATSTDSGRKQLGKAVAEGWRGWRAGFALQRPIGLGLGTTSPRTCPITLLANLSCHSRLLYRAVTSSWDDSASASCCKAAPAPAAAAAPAVRRQGVCSPSPPCAACLLQPA